jgi:hypothetical protein
VAIFDRLKLQVMEEKYVKNLLVKFPVLEEIGPIKAMIDKRLTMKLNGEVL